MGSAKSTPLKQPLSSTDPTRCSPLYFALLKVVNDAKTQPELERGFLEVATLLLLQSTLQIAGKPYELMDVEFYFYNAEVHPDPYSHSFQYANSVRSKQSVTGAWYFHRFTGMAKYTHTRRGLDLTYGDGDRQRYGGILIRGIKSILDQRLITGPSRVVGEIISAMDNPLALERIAFDKQAGFAFDPNSLLFLESLASPIDLPLYTSSRFGISDKDPFYQQKHYRFFTDITPVKKGNPPILHKCKETEVENQHPD